MSCNKDSSCLNLSRTTYPSLKDDIVTSFQSANKEVSKVIDTIQSIQVPDDYLGSKVAPKLEALLNNFNNDIDSLNTEKTNVKTFILAKIDEHEQHYQDWKKQQEVWAKKKKEMEENEKEGKIVRA